MKVMNLLLNGLDKKHTRISITLSHCTLHLELKLSFNSVLKHVKTIKAASKQALVYIFVPVHDAHRGLSLFNESHSTVVVPLVLDGHAADLHHNLPELLGSASALFRTWELFACGSQELPDLETWRQVL